MAVSKTARSASKGKAAPSTSFGVQSAPGDPLGLDPTLFDEAGNLRPVPPAAVAAKVPQAVPVQVQPPAAVQVQPQMFAPAPTYQPQVFAPAPTYQPQTFEARPSFSAPQAAPPAAVAGGAAASQAATQAASGPYRPYANSETLALGESAGRPGVSQMLEADLGAARQAEQVEVAAPRPVGSLDFGSASTPTDRDLRGMAEVYPIFDTTEATPPPATPDTTSFGERALMGAPQGPQMYDLEADTRALVKGIPMVGAQRVNLDKLQVEGANQMGAALSKLGQEYATLGQRAAAGEERYMQEYDKYRTGLGELAARGETMRGVRGIERQIEAQQNAAAQMSFDANRVYREFASNPLNTGALALAAGIVQGLQGYAGQDKPNAIIAAVQDAAQRDVANQMEQYKRMQAGQQTARNNFIEARQALQDDQQALQLTAMATLDQISKGLDFVKARTLRAKERADIELAQGKIEMDLGAAQVQLLTDFANRSLTAAMANQREASDIAQKMINARDSFNKQTQAAQQHAIDSIRAFLKTEDGQAMTEGLTNVTNFYQELAAMKRNGASDKEIFAAISQDFLGDLTNNLRIAANNVKGQDGNALARAFEGLTAETIANATLSPEERKVRGMVANSFQAYLRQTLGKSQTSPELVNARLVVNLKDPQSVLNFMNNIVTNAQQSYQQQVRIDPVAAPKWYEAYGSMIDTANAYYNSIGAPVRQSARMCAK